MSNPTELQHRLEYLNQKLRNFDQNLKENFARLDTAWTRLDAAWDGHAYQEFNESWQTVRRQMRQYNDLSAKYEAFLHERIASLADYEKGNL